MNSSRLLSVQFWRDTSDLNIRFSFVFVLICLRLELTVESISTILASTRTSVDWLLLRQCDKCLCLSRWLLYWWCALIMIFIKQINDKALESVPIFIINSERKIERKKSHTTWSLPSGHCLGSILIFARQMLEQVGIQQKLVALSARNVVYLIVFWHWQPSQCLSMNIKKKKK